MTAEGKPLVFERRQLADGSSAPAEACRVKGDVEGILDALVEAIVKTQIPPRKPRAT